MRASPLSIVEIINRERTMTVKLVVGLDGTETGDRALAFAKDLASKIDASELIVIYVIQIKTLVRWKSQGCAVRHKIIDQFHFTIFFRIY